jgi:hypothetical protein
MKISDHIRSAADETPKEQLQDWSNEWLAEEHDPESVLPVDNAEEAEEAEEVPPSEMEALTQGKVVRDTGFLTVAEKKLLKKKGWKVVTAAGWKKSVKRSGVPGGYLFYRRADGYVITWDGTNKEWFLTKNPPQLAGVPEEIGAFPTVKDAMQAADKHAG